jgi:hypothetical protein
MHGEGSCPRSITGHATKLWDLRSRPFLPPGQTAIIPDQTPSKTEPPHVGGSQLDRKLRLGTIGPADVPELFQPAVARGESHLDDVVGLQ